MKKYKLYAIDLSNNFKSFDCLVCATTKNEALRTFPKPSAIPAPSAPKLGIKNEQSSIVTTAPYALMRNADV